MSKKLIYKKNYIILYNVLYTYKNHNQNHSDFFYP